MTIHLLTMLDEAYTLQDRNELWQAVALARAYLRANPPWKDRTLVWFCRACAESGVPPEARAGKSWNPDRGPRGCDRCGRDPVDAAELEAILVDLK